MNNQIKNYKIVIAVLLATVIAGIIYLVSLKLAYPVFQETRLLNPLAELHSLFPLHWIAIGIISLAGLACFIYRVENRGVHLLLLLLLAVMLWYTPNHLAEYAHLPDGPRDLGVSLQISGILRGDVFPCAEYAAGYPLSYVLSYVLTNTMGLDSLTLIQFFPLISILLYTLLCYTFTSRLFNSPTAFFTTLLAIMGMHYTIFVFGAHAIGVLLLLSALVMLWRKDIISRSLTFLFIIATIICHPISPIILGMFLAAALVVGLIRQRINTQVVVLLMLVVCMVGWFIWPSLSLVSARTPQSIPAVGLGNIQDTGIPVTTGVPVEGIPAETEKPARIKETEADTEEFQGWVEDMQRKIFPGEFQITPQFLVGKAFIYEGIYNVNKAIYYLYALLAAAGVGYILYRTRRQCNRWRVFLSQRGGLSDSELFLVISIPMLLVFIILLAESQHVLIERGLTFAVLVLAGLIASTAARIYQVAAQFTRKLFSYLLVVIVLFLSLSFPVVAYSIDAYSSFPVSEESALKFMAAYVPLDTMNLATNSQGQISLYRHDIASSGGLDTSWSIKLGDVLAFRRTGYYYASLRHDLSFEDNWFTRYLSIVEGSNEFGIIYFNPTTSIFLKIP